MKEYNIEDYLNPELSKEIIEELVKENAELKKQIEAQKGLITVGGKKRYEYLQQIEELEQENAELKEKVKSLEEIADNLQQRNHNLTEELEKTNEEAEYFINGDYCDEKCETAKNELKYKQTLNAIKEIAEEYLTDCQGFKCEAMEEIIQKITKAEVGE